MTTVWKPGANGQASPTTPVVVLVDGVFKAVEPLGYTVIINPDLMKDEYVPHQVTPPLTRTWGGDDPNEPTDTVQLAFADEEAARAALPELWSAVV